MTNDASSPQERPSGPRLWDLPRLVEVRSLRVRYPRPRQRLIDGKPVEIKEGVELHVQTDAEIPIRALSPALFIGATEVAENRAAPDGLSHRFLVDDEAALDAGAEITLGWVGHPPEPRAGRKATFKYEPPRETIDDPGPRR